MLLGGAREEHEHWLSNVGRTVAEGVKDKARAMPAKRAGSTTARAISWVSRRRYEIESATTSNRCRPTSSAGERPRE